MLKILDAQAGENLKIIKKLFEEYAESLGFDLSFQNFNEELANLPGEYAPSMGCLLLAMYQNEAAGCVALRRIDKTICEMKRLFVRPQFRRQGMGGHWLKRSLNEPKEPGTNKCASILRQQWTPPETCMNLWDLRR